MNRKILPWSVIVLGILSTVVYVTDVFRGSVHTTLVTWIVLVTASGMNLGVVYLKTRKLDFEHHSALIIGALGQSCILIAVIIEGASTDITPFHMVTFAGSCAGFAIFLWQRKHAIISVVAINTAVLIGFIPMWTHLSGGGVVESLGAWALIAIAAGIGTIIPFSQRNYLAFIFPLRATITGVSVTVMTLWNMYI